MSKNKPDELASMLSAHLAVGGPYVPCPDGFSAWHTGGGCWMYGRSFGPDGRYSFGITAPEDADFPDDPQRCLLVLRDEETSEDLAWLQNASLATALSWARIVEEEHDREVEFDDGLQEVPERTTMLRLLSKLIADQAFGCDHAPIKGAQFLERLIADKFIEVTEAEPYFTVMYCTDCASAIMQSTPECQDSDSYPQGPVAGEADWESDNPAASSPSSAGISREQFLKLVAIHQGQEQLVLDMLSMAEIPIIES